MPNVLIAHVIIGAIVFGGSALIGYMLYDLGKQKGRDAERNSKPSVYHRVLYVLADDVDRIAEAIYPTLVTDSSPIGLKNAAEQAYVRAEAFVKAKQQRYK